MNEQNSGYRFERIEKKFWMNPDQYRELNVCLNENMKEGKFPLSEICNIYYDTDDFWLIRNSIERPLFKEKIRLRSYGIPEDDTPVFVEIKKKLNGIGYKRRVKVNYGDALKLLCGNSVNCSEPQIEKEILEFVKRYEPKPQVYLTYKRMALVGKDDPDFRVTIDTDLRYSIWNEHSKISNDGENIMDDSNMVLMEIKSSSAIPEWLMNEISRLKIYQAPFSKIGTCYLKHIAPSTVNGTL